MSCLSNKRYNHDARGLVPVRIYTVPRLKVMQLPAPCMILETWNYYYFNCTCLHACLPFISIPALYIAADGPKMHLALHLQVCLTIMVEYCT